MIAADFPTFHYTYDEEGNMPIITVEVMSDSSNSGPIPNYDIETASTTQIDSLEKDTGTGVHFLTEQNEQQEFKDEIEMEEGSSAGRSEMLEYMIRHDGSVICKLCGEILQSRTHWYRHKYKHHVIQSQNPTSLFQCEQCLVFFKSRKGYIGHITTRHGEPVPDTIPVLSNSQIEAITKDKVAFPVLVKEEPDPEMVLPKTSVPTYQTTIIKHASKPTDTKRPYRKDQIAMVRPADWEEQRIREDKLVSDIIDRVRRECEAQDDGGAGPARRGYSRRTTVMHT